MSDYQYLFTQTYDRKMHSGDKSVEFDFPAGIAASKKALFPTCQVHTPDYAATVALDIIEKENIVQVSVTGNMTVNLDIAAHVTPGATIQAHITGDGSVRTITWGTGFLAPNLATVANKQHSVLFIYNGTAFVQAGAQIQLN